MTRRRFLAVVGGGAAALVAGGAAWACGEDTWDLQLTRVDVPVPALPPQLDGLRIIHLSDLHAGLDVPETFLHQALQLAAHTRAEMICLTGDYVSHDWRFLNRILPQLAQLHAPLGVYACLGNHDQFYNRARHIAPMLRRAGVTVLCNTALPLPGCSDAWLVGLDDPCTSHHDFEAALRHVPPRACKILLAHTPDVVEAAAQLGIHLTLAGHTHGGQVRFPLLGPVIVPSRYGPRYASGLFQCGAMRMFVTRGVGLVAPVLRYRCPPEVAVLTLRRADWKLPTGAPGVNLRPWGRALRDEVSRVRRVLHL